MAEDKEHGCRTSADFRREGEETVLLFRLDDQGTKKRPGLIDKKCCDSLYFVRNKSGSLLIFLELKSSDHAEAKEQILNAYTAIYNRSEHVKKKACKIFAVIVTSQGAPRNVKEMQREMKNRGIDLYVGTSKGRACDLRTLLGLG